MIRSHAFIHILFSTALFALCLAQDEASIPVPTGIVDPDLLPDADAKPSPVVPPAQAAAAVASLPDIGCAIDICFAMDFSGSINDADFGLQKQFVVNLVDDIEANLAPNQNARYSAVRFATTVTPIQTPLTTNVDGFKASINGLSENTQGLTNTAMAIEQCGEILNPADLTRRKVLVLITDGDPTVPDVATGSTVALTAASVIRPPVQILAVGVGSVNTQFLNDVTQNPSLVFQVNDFQDLSQVITAVVQGACNGAGEGCAEAEQNCKFTFQGLPGLNTFNIMGLPDRPFTPRIVSKDPGVFVRDLNSNNVEAEFIADDGTVTLVSQKIPPPVQPFTPTQFKPYALPAPQVGSGVGFETFQRDQIKFAKGMCVRVFFSHWQVLSGPNGNNIGNVNGVTDKSQNFCVVFRTAE